MKPLATIIVPTHNHTETLYPSVQSALNQTVREIEVLIIGDGVCERTREIVRDLQKDGRVFFYDFEKSARHGEQYRDEIILKHVRAENIFYLCDDDLYFPDHVERTLKLLQEANFVNGMALIRTDESWTVLPVDLSQKSNISIIADGYTNRFGLTCAAHTADFYRRLTYGWRSTPADFAYTDWYMWQQCLKAPYLVALSAAVPSILNFPAYSRKSMSNESRRAELDLYLEILASEEQVNKLRHDSSSFVIKSAAREMAHLTYENRFLKEQIEEREELLAQMSANQKKIESDCLDLKLQCNQALKELTERLLSIENSRTWRLSQRVLNRTALGSVLKMVARRLARANKNG